ncbi:MAG: PQQ-binding-like beta-propeller repeat protein [Planctomycetes bacterium]|nr:PQQ-binding-like beta-propeller repeat protein [Planctomycetota bacterium]
MKNKLRYLCLLCAAALGWWTAVGLEYVAGEAAKKNSQPELTIDWSQWGGDSKRNNTPVGYQIPTQWNIGSFDYRTGEWDSSKAENIKWVARLGSQTYGNAVVADGKIYVGTNNSGGWLKRYPAKVDLGCLLCFNVEDGKFLWQHSSEKLPSGRVHDWPLQGICCAPLVEDDRLWFVTSRGEVRCLDTNGFYDGVDNGNEKGEQLRIVDITPTTLVDSGKVDKEDKPIMVKLLPLVMEGLKQEKIIAHFRELLAERGEPTTESIAITSPVADKQWLLTAKFNGVERDLTANLNEGVLSIYKTSSIADKDEADVVWVFDMMKELGISQHNMCSCSVTSAGDILLVNTSNGVDVEHNYIPAPNAPSFFAMDKNTGKVLWTDSSPGLNILHGQWSSPAYAVLGGQPQVIFAGGDGWVYSFDPAGQAPAEKGALGKSKLLWKFDANPKTSVWELGGRGTRNNIIATPVIHQERVFVAVGQDPEHGEGVGHLWCLDPTKRGDVSPDLAFNATAPKTQIAPKRIQSVVPEEGDLTRPNPNSAAIWHYSEFDQNTDGEIDFEETMHRSCGTVTIRDNVLYIADFSGLFHCLDAETGAVNWTYDMLAAAWGSPLIVEDKVYIGDEDGEVAIFRHSSDREIAMQEVDGEWEPHYGTRDMGNSVYSTPIVSNNVLYISNRTHLFAIVEDKKQ